MPEAFRSGEAIPETGIYRLSHSAHRLPAEVTLTRGDTFPSCSRCRETVFFYMVRPATGFRESPFRVRLHTLPVIDVIEEPPKAA
jgi:hypothetical protein